MKALIILFICFILIGCSQDQNQFSINRGNYQRTGTYITSPISKVKKVIWEVNPGKRSYDTNPIMYENKIFIGDNRGDIHIMDSSTGKELATTSIDYESHSSSSFLGQQIQIDDNVLYFNIAGLLCAVDINTLQLIWRQKILWAYSPVIVGEQILYSYKNELVAANKSDGSKLWSIKVGENKNDFITSDLCMDDGLIYLGTDQKMHYAIDIKKKTIVWKKKLDGKEFPTSRVLYLKDESESVISEQTILIFDSGSIIALQSKSGEEKWRGTYNYVSLPAVSGNKVVFNKENSIECISLLDGSRVWEFSKKYFYPRTPPIIVASYIYFNYEGDMGTGALKCLDLNTGNEIWDYQPGASSTLAPLVNDSKMYLPLSFKFIALE